MPFFKATCVYFVLWLPSSNPSWVSALVKCLPIFCLWLFLLAHGFRFLLSHSSASLIFVGLVFSAVGDAFLIWEDHGYFENGQWLEGLPGRVPGAGGKRILGWGWGKALEEGTGSWRAFEGGDFGLLLEEDQFSKGEGEFKSTACPTPLCHS